MVSGLCAGFWVFHQDEGAAPWRDLCPLTSSTPTTTACSRWSSTWVCHCGSTSQSLSLVFLPSFLLVRASRHEPPFVSFLGSKRRVFVRRIPTVLPVIASLIKHFIIGLLAGWRRRSVTLFIYLFIFSVSAKFAVWGRSNLACLHSDQSSRSFF